MGYTNSGCARMFFAKTWRDACVVLAHVRQTWLWYVPTFARLGAILLSYPLRVLGGSGSSSSDSGDSASYSGSNSSNSRSSTTTAGPSAAGGGRSAPVLCPGSVGAMLTTAEGRTRAHWPAWRNATVCGNLRRTSANAAPPSPPSPSGGQCRATSNHTPASVEHAVASWRVRRLCVLQCARRG